jgi:hypothetical protein
MYIINKYTNEVAPVKELSDYLWQEGWRMVDSEPFSSSDEIYKEIEIFRNQMSIEQYGF